MRKLFFHFGIIFKMLLDFIKGNYNGLSLKGLITIIAAIVYLVFPIDLIPDFIPIAGQGDDFLILSIAYLLLSEDIEKYEKWKNKEK